MEKVTQKEIFDDLYMYLCHKYAQICPLQAVHVYLKLYCSLNPNDSKIFAHVDDPLRDYSMVGKVAIDASEYITNKYHDKAPDTVSIMTGYLYGLASKYGEQI